jgi:hypothetical protein
MSATFITRGHVALPFPSRAALAAWLVQRTAGAPIELLPQQIQRGGVTLDVVAVFTRRTVTRTDRHGGTVTAMSDVWHGWAARGAADPVALRAAIDSLITPAQAAPLSLAGAA